MSQLNVDVITNKDGAGSPSFSKGAVVTGVITSTTFDGNLIGNVTGNVSGSSGSATGNAATATKLANARNIGGVSFDGSSDINLPGVNQAGNQNTTGTSGGLTGTPNISVGTINAGGHTVGTSATFTGNVSIGGTLTYEDVKNVDSVGLITAKNGLNVTAGVATFAGAVDINNNVSISGGSQLGNLSVAGISTFTGTVDINSAVTDIDGHLEIDNVNISGVTTATTINATTKYIGRLESIPATNKTSSATAAKSDAGTLITTDSQFIIPQNIFAAGDIISVYNNSGSDIQISQGTGVTLRLAGGATTGNRTLAQRGLMTVTCVASNEFVCSGGGLT